MIRSCKEAHVKLNSVPHVEMNSTIHNGVDKNAAARRIRSSGRRRRTVLTSFLVLVCVVVLNHWWWKSTVPTINDSRMSTDKNVQLSTAASRKHGYVGTGQWRNRGLNLVACLRSMLSSDETYEGETIEVTIRKLQLLYLRKEGNRSSHFDYLRELQGSLYPSLCSSNNTVGRADDGYLDFCRQTLPKINAWNELDTMLESLKRNRKASSQRKQLSQNAARAKQGDEAAASLLAMELTKQRSDRHHGFLIQQSPKQAALLNGPSVAVLTENDLLHSDDASVVAGFELRKRVDDNTSNVPVVDLAFYKQYFEMTGGGGGEAVVVLRPHPGSHVSCIVAREAAGNHGASSFFYACETEDESGTRDGTEPLPVIGLLFGPDFGGGCNVASRMLDSYGLPPTNGEQQHRDNVLWGQEIQNVLSSVSASMREKLYVASYDVHDDGTINVQCHSVVSFWSNENGNDDHTLWQSYRNIAALEVGLDWKLSKCLVRLPLRDFPNAKVINQTHGMIYSPPAFDGQHVQNACYGSTGSACIVATDESTLCELVCEHSGSYTLFLGVQSTSGQHHHGPACFELERRLETPVDRHGKTTWLAQEDADPVRWNRTKIKAEDKELHSVTLVFTSDVHGRFFRECGSSYCYPGAPHIASVIQTVRSAESRSGRTGAAILVDAGDATFGSQYNETLVGMTMNRLGYEAMALGNHELDIGPQRLDEFADLATFPIISANVKGVPFTTEFVRIGLKGGATICLLGVSANEYNPLAGRKVTYNSDDAFVVEMARNLRSKHGCNHTALLSHAGIEADKKLATKANIDAIVGGHSHVLMGVHSTDHVPESSEFGAVTDMTFPFNSGGGTPVAHTGANGRYIGLLRLSWVGDRLVNSKGSLIPLDSLHGVFPDYDVDEWQSKLIEKGSHTDQAESTKVNIDTSLTRNELCGQTCRIQECLIGNIATDAMVSCVIHGPCSEYAKNASAVATVALLESGTLRACVAPDIEDFSEILPWPNTLVLLTMTGASVRKMLEHGLKDMKDGQGGAFLQVSGLKYLYRDMSVEKVFLSESDIRPPTDELRALITFSAGNIYQTAVCGLPEVESHGTSLDDDSLYLVVVTDWLASGGDGYQDIVSSADIVTTNTTLRDAILQHAKSRPTVSEEARSESVDSKLTTSTKQGISGFFGGAISFLATYPLYTLFVQRSASRKVSFSLHDLFAGSMMGMLATALSQAIYFWVYSSPALRGFSAFARASFAAVSNSAVTTPLWVITTHLQVEHCQMNAYAIAKHIYEDSGPIGFFAGFSMNMVMCIFPVVRQVSC